MTALLERGRGLVLICIGLLAVGGLVTLSWNDVLPGGWRLRGWVEPHAERLTDQQERYAERRMQLFTQENQSVGADAVIWIGSSTIERFPAEDLFPGHDHVDRGINNEAARELGQRIPECLPQARPKLLVFYIGSIDHRRLRAEPEDLVERARSIVARSVRFYGEANPVPAAVIGILPERDMDADFVALLERTNAALAALCASEDWTFVPTHRAPIRLPDGSLNPDVAADQLHLNRAGYEALAGWMRAAGLLAD